MRYSLLLFGAIFCFLFKSQAQGPPPPAAWKNELDVYIRQHSHEGKIHVSYHSLVNMLDQYHRNANQPIPSTDVVKVPIVAYALLHQKQRLFDASKLVVASADAIAANQTGFLGVSDIGKEFSLQQLLDVALPFNDNAATNFLLENMGYETLTERLRSIGSQNIYIRKPLSDSVRNTSYRMSNFVTTADFSTFLRKLHTTWPTKQRDVLYAQLGEIAAQANYFGFDEKNVAAFQENSQLAKGFAGIMQGNKPYVICVFITEFSSDAAANRLLQDISLILSGKPLNPEKVN